MTERNETMVETFPGLPKVPQWVFDYCRELDTYMSKHHPGPWAVDGVQSRTHPPGEVTAEDWRKVIDALAKVSYSKSHREAVNFADSCLEDLAELAHAQLLDVIAGQRAEGE